MRLAWRGVLILAVVLIAAGLTSPTPTTGTHMVPVPKYFWDPDQNGVPGPEPAVRPAGGFWESVRLARLDAALAEWRNDTTFDPTRTSSGSQYAYVDGRDAPCLPNGWDGFLAVVCRTQVAVVIGTSISSYRITDLDVYFNMENPTSPDWWIGSTFTTDFARVDFQGIMTHELGHWVRLTDVYDDPSCADDPVDRMTMCGVFPPDDRGRYGSWRSRSLHSHDISAANAVY